MAGAGGEIERTDFFKIAKNTKGTLEDKITAIETAIPTGFSEFIVKLNLARISNLKLKLYDYFGLFSDNAAVYRAANNYLAMRASEKYS